MMECTSISTPMALKSTITSSDELPIDPRQCRQIVVSLQYLTFTRPGIVHSINKACQHFQAPTESDLKAIKRILRYLKGTIDYKIRFLKQSSLRLTSFCDANLGRLHEHKKNHFWVMYFSGSQLYFLVL